MPEPADDRPVVSAVNEQKSVDIDLEAIEKLAEYIMKAEDSRDAGELSIAFVDKREMARLNKAYRGKEGPTDVLSFTLKGGEGDAFVSPVPLLGSVVICPEVAAENAAVEGREIDDEINVLVIHGVLHTLDYSHEDEKREREMSLRQADLFKGFIDGDVER